jgi:GTPase
MDLSMVFPRKIISSEFQDQLDQEPEEGSIEYKLHLVSISGHRLEKFKSQLKWRVAEGSRNSMKLGIATYYIGVEDSGIPLGISGKQLIESIKNLKKVCEELKLEPEIMYIKKGSIENCFVAKINIYKKELSESKASIF